MLEQRQALRDGRQALRHVVAQGVHRLKRVGLRLVMGVRVTARGRVQDAIANEGRDKKRKQSAILAPGSQKNATPN